MSFMIRFAILACLASPLLSISTSSLAAESEAEKAAKAAALAEAIAACDRGAAVPLDPQAKSAPVQFGQLPLAHKQELRTLAGKCHEAVLGAPLEKRLILQWLRTQVRLDDPGLMWLIPQIKEIADSGSAEASYLLFRIFERHRNDADTSTLVISRDLGLDALRTAGDAGHLEALQKLLNQYNWGPLLRRDPKKAVETARKIADAPPQGIAPGEREVEFKSIMPLLIAEITLEQDGFSPAEQEKAFAVVDADSKSGTEGRYYRPALAYITALRLGRGTRQDAVKARQLLEKRSATDPYFVPALAEMYANGEGGPVDGKRAIAILREERVERLPDRSRVLATLLLDGRFVGRQPQEAIRLLLSFTGLDEKIQAAGLLLGYHPAVDEERSLTAQLRDGMAAGEPGAGLALARLLLSDNGHYRDANAAQAVLKTLADQGDRTALWLLASSQYANLDMSTARADRRHHSLNDDELKRLIDEGLGKKEPEAFLLAARFLRQGVIYPQDDQAATGHLISAANLGNVEAMVLLGDAYDDGLGIEKNPRERLRAWREAARRGSLKATSKLANAFVFDSFDKLVTLREGVTNRIVLAINGVDRMAFGGLFSGGRISDAGTSAVTEAVMDAFREAPAGLEEQMLIGFGKALPDEIRIAIETKLKDDGFYAGEPKGYWGPDARKALTAWVDEKGPLADTAEPPPTDKQPPQEEMVATEIVDRLRDRAFQIGMAAKTPEEQVAAVKLLNALARYGDIAPRWALVRNYHQSQSVRSVVTAPEIVRYGLDILVTKPDSAEKAEFEFIFDLTQITQDGKSAEAGEAIVAAIRDDSRLQDPLTLGGVMGQFIFAPAACEAVLDAAKKAGVADLGPDGCDEASRTALMDFARKQGPAGIEAAARKAAATEIMSLEAQASK